MEKNQITLTKKQVDKLISCIGYPYKHFSPDLPENYDKVTFFYGGWLYCHGQQSRWHIFLFNYSTENEWAALQSAVLEHLEESIL